jgi:hypothetical protein
MTIKRQVVAGLAGAALLGLAVPLWAHHSMAAFYDDKKSITLRGTVTKYDWTNPHVWVYLDVNEAGGKVSTWEVEFDSKIELKRVGWTRDSLQVGDQVSLDANPARDGRKRGGGKSITLAGGKKLLAVALAPAPARPAAAQSKATPRWPDGHPRLGAMQGALGYWVNNNGGGLYDSGAGNIRMNREGLLANIADADKVAPFQPWSKGLYEYRQRNLLKDDPMAFCLPPGGPRQFQVPYGLNFLEDPDRKRIFVISGGANRNWRLIYWDGRAVPAVEDAPLTYFGNSSGHWEGDALVVTAQGFLERFWFTNGGLPHSESLKLTEHFSRPDFNTLKYEVTVDDPGTYTRPWGNSWNLQWVPNQEMEEYYCDEYNRESERQEVR